MNYRKTLYYILAFAFVTGAIFLAYSSYNYIFADETLSDSSSFNTDDFNHREIGDEIIVSNIKICSKSDNSYNCNKVNIDFCKSLEKYDEVKKCILYNGINNNITSGCSLVLKSKDRNDCILKIALANNNAINCQKIYNAEGVLNKCISDICDKLPKGEEKALCYFNSKGITPNIELCSFIERNYTKNQCYDNYAERGDNYGVGLLERRKACNKIDDFVNKKTCKFYSGAFLERTIAVIIIGWIAIYLLFYYIIKIYKKVFNKPPSKIIMFIIAVLVSIGYVFMVVISQIPFAGILFDNYWMINKMICPPDGSGGCSGRGWIPSPTLRGLFSYIAAPMVYIFLAFVALTIQKAPDPFFIKYLDKITKKLRK